MRATGRQQNIIIISTSGHYNSQCADCCDFNRYSLITMIIIYTVIIVPEAINYDICI